MNKLLFVLLLVSTSAFAGKYEQLFWRMNKETMVVISNAPCKVPEYKNKFPFAAGAFSTLNKKNNAIDGCYTKSENGMIKIQWYAGDMSILNASSFIQLDKPKSKAQQKQDAMPKIEI